MDVTTVFRLKMERWSFQLQKWENLGGGPYMILDKLILRFLSLTAQVRY